MSSSFKAISNWNWKKDQHKSGTRHQINPRTKMDGSWLSPRTICHSSLTTSTDGCHKYANGNIFHSKRIDFYGSPSYPLEDKKERIFFFIYINKKKYFSFPKGMDRRVYKHNLTNALKLYTQSLRYYLRISQFFYTFAKNFRKPIRGLIHAYEG